MPFRRPNTSQPFAASFSATLLDIARSTPTIKSHERTTSCLCDQSRIKKPPFPLKRPTRVEGGSLGGSRCPSLTGMKISDGQPTLQAGNRNRQLAACFDEYCSSLYEQLWCSVHLFRPSLGLKKNLRPLQCLHPLAHGRMTYVVLTSFTQLFSFIC
ncbi:hypothetical protein B0H16DRAFT_587508 [Mycena metata]|uniref:Uncharacterized protein n=1 Tax=Mycena metata TaxID=1033252 RepID=A0AAD7JB11_9AGAR|nr:hypothetical protein B0H16DRAFT_587508 [Mycena metata]